VPPTLLARADEVIEWSGASSSRCSGCGGWVAEMREVWYNTRADSVAHHRNDDRNGGRGLLGGKSPWRAMRHNHVRLAGDKLPPKKQQS
jgi:hypothetical protein